VDWRAALSPKVGHIGLNWVTILVCLFLSFIAYLYCFDYACGVALHLDLCLFLLLLGNTLSIDYHFFCSTHPFIHWCDFVRVHNNIQISARPSR